MRDEKPKIVRRIKRLRLVSTDAERRLWSRLRNRQIGGAKFLRQAAIGSLVVDFVCRERRLIVEIDGGQHLNSATDRMRDALLRSRNYRVLRFWNNDVLANSEGVFEAIGAALLETHPHPDPLTSKSDKSDFDHSMRDRTRVYPSSVASGERGKKTTK
jgi:very-short-patch-repair endonuclease